MATKLKTKAANAANKQAPKVRDLKPGKDPKGGVPLTITVKVTRKPAG